MNNNQDIASTYYVSSVFGHSLVYFARELVHGADCFAGDPPAPTAQESTAEMLRAYTEGLPGLLRVTSQNILPTEQAMLDARKTLSPQQSALELDLYNQFGPQFAEVGNQVARIGAMGQASNDAAVLAGPGREVVQNATALQRLADPEYYAAREQASQALGNMFSGLPDAGTGLDGAERAEIERSLARNNQAKGNTTPTNIGTVSEAMKFGAAGANRQAAKQAQIAQAVGTATNFLGPSQSRVDTFQQVTGRPSQNFGQTQFSGPVQQAGATTFGTGQSLMGQIGAQQQNSAGINANRRDTFDRIIQGTPLAGGCCWIFLAAHGGALPWWVRKCRNDLGTPQIRAGYRRMSEWLVPHMARSRVLRWLVRTIMTEPVSMYGGYLLNAPNQHNGWVFRPVKRFWFAVWNRLGA